MTFKFDDKNIEINDIDFIIISINRKSILFLDETSIRYSFYFKEGEIYQTSKTPARRAFFAIDF